MPCRQTDSLFDLPFGPSFDATLEERHAALFGGRLAGVDEAGRGPWAGPVVTAAVVLDYRRLPAGLDDSKRLSEVQREALYEEICASACVAVASACPTSIDRDNIRTATLAAMTRAVDALALTAGIVLIDGRDVPPGLAGRGQALVKGDQRCLAVAAASIVAKVTRDRMMRLLDGCCPGYGFSAHKGYGVPAHAQALLRLGPSPHHRLSFKPVAAAGRPE
ncbi:Ribonuclease HII [Polymorphum gilvum SL003B-26A1]|uniref:Ribonuclease HII n=2 Tax=Polymorphum TaxID=991903 RepID=F2IZ56_POLGS|nr:Ribonuclease HII [Polymorphum gilvum SL003B-26A1]